MAIQKPRVKGGEERQEGKVNDPWCGRGGYGPGQWDLSPSCSYSSLGTMPRHIQTPLPEAGEITSRLISEGWPRGRVEQPAAPLCSAERRNEWIIVIFISAQFHFIVSSSVGCVALISLRFLWRASNAWSQIYSCVAPCIPRTQEGYHIVLPSREIIYQICFLTIQDVIFSICIFIF